MAITIKTNHKARAVLRWYDLTAKEQAEFDYLDTEDRQDEAEFVRYRGVTYDLGEFTSLRVTGTPEFQSWDGVHSDSFFSGVLVRFVHDGGEYDVVMGTFIA